ncbi:MAG: hypothetical protein IJ600_07015 [Lachnospiraceae bacterium]|nr:hypothetical protein [Lachnospiraceae bacterium]
MKQRGLIKIIVIMALVVGVILAFYIRLTRRNAEAVSTEAAGGRAVQEMTVVQKMIAEAAYKEYPSTPVQLLRYYNDITLCLYNEECSQDELKALMLISRRYMDDEVLQNQSEGEQLIELRKDVEAFKTQEIRIYSVDVTPSLDVDFFSYDGYECARLYSTYTLKGMIDGSVAYNTKRQIFILRKDGDGHWKIFGYKTEEDETDGSTEANSTL